MNQWPLIFEELKALIYTAPATVLALSVHEFCHGSASYLLGDPTPKTQGRLSLNPLHHLDLYGTICLLLFHFGWAKPVQVNARYYKHPKRDMALVALAGPMSNFVMAFLFTGLLSLLSAHAIEGYLFQLVLYVVLLNIGLGLFNLIPVPPLDGAKIFGALLPDKWYFGIMRYEKYIGILMLALMYFGILTPVLSSGRSLIFRWMLSVWMK